MDALLIRPRETAIRLNISLSTCYELISKGIIPSVRLGKSIRVPVQELETKLQALRRDSVSPAA